MTPTVSDCRLSGNSAFPYGGGVGSSSSGAVNATTAGDLPASVRQTGGSSVLTSINESSVRSLANPCPFLSHYQTAIDWGAAG